MGICLFALYLAFMSLIGASILSGPMTEVEALIFYTLLLRVLAVWFIPYLRRTHAQVKIALFSIETFVLVILIFGFVFTGQQAYDELIGQVLTAWIGASSIVLTPYLIYQISANMNKGMSSSALVLSATPELVVGVFLVGFAVAEAATPPNGISAFGNVLIGSIRAQTVLQNTQLVDSSPFVVGVSLIVFLCLLFYIGVKQRYLPTTTYTPLAAQPNSASSPRYHYQLVLLLAGAVITIFWILLSSNPLGGDELFVLSLPAVLISATLWALARRGD